MLTDCRDVLMLLGKRFQFHLQ